MMWLEALSRDTDLGVPEPLANRDGALVTTVEVDGVPQARHCVVFGWMPGPDLADRLTLENVQKMGALSARLHAHAETFRPPPEFSIKTADSVFPFGDEVVLFDKAHRDLVPPARRELFQRVAKRVEDALGELFADRQGLRVLHYDLHHWNVKAFRGKLYALDFEDLMWGYPVQDIAITFYYWQGPRPVWGAARGIQARLHRVRRLAGAGARPDRHLYRRAGAGSGQLYPAGSKPGMAEQRPGVPREGRDAVAGIHGVEPGPTPLRCWPGSCPARNGFHRAHLRCG